MNRITVMLGVTMILRASCQGGDVWDEARTMLAAVSEGAAPSKVLHEADGKYSILLVEDTLRLFLIQHPEGGCIAGFPSKSRFAFFRKGEMTLSAPMSYSNGDGSIVWDSGRIVSSEPKQHEIIVMLVRKDDPVVDRLILKPHVENNPVEWKFGP